MECLFARHVSRDIKIHELQLKISFEKPFYSLSFQRRKGYTLDNLKSISPWGFCPVIQGKNRAARWVEANMERNMSAGSDMVVVVIFVSRQYFLSRFLSQNRAPRDHPQMARAFSCVTLLPHYIGYMCVLYVNDLNRLLREELARRSRARINFARVNSESTCPSRTRGNAL